ncbi:MAG: 7-carboxy-7-deazaguanine synthase QueE [Deltaproteobacteria bacterium]|nr:7-carboxy-7-deazaguanine synthase QueE [Deltaproteobacteria bacterium]MDZ4224432.1 7-carboxy-7-deazaguanine synthase QueE [bacterium]
MLLKLAEIFYSIQGEGHPIGRPSIFIRTSLCNLKCKWCDTPYTWDWEKYDMEKEVVEKDVEEVLSIVKKWDCKNIVLTGGEPMLQQKALTALMALLKPKGYLFDVETNATLAMDADFKTLIDQYNCSPKLVHSGNSRIASETPHFNQYARNPKSWFKFVIKTPKDVDQVLRMTKRYAISANRVILMPEGTSAEKLNERSGWLSHLAYQNGFAFTSRLHIEKWGNKRGV